MPRNILENQLRNSLKENFPNWTPEKIDESIKILFDSCTQSPSLYKVDFEGHTLKVGLCDKYGHKHYFVTETGIKFLKFLGKK